MSAVLTLTAHVHHIQQVFLTNISTPGVMKLHKKRVLQANEGEDFHFTVNKLRISRPLTPRAPAAPPKCPHMVTTASKI